MATLESAAMDNHNTFNPDPAATLEDLPLNNETRQDVRLEIGQGEAKVGNNFGGAQPESQQHLVTPSGEPNSQIQGMPQFEPMVTRKAPSEVREFSAKRFYCTRPGTFEHAVEDVKQYCEPSLDGKFKGAWLLTEIDHWDHEKERLVILTEFQLLIIKYDFVALRINDCRRISLKTIEKVQSGGFIFPERSMMRPSEAHRKLGVTNSERHFQTGIRIHVDKSMVMTRWQRWSPFFKDVPFVTFHQHKVATLLDQLTPELIYEDFKKALVQALTDIGVPFDAVLEPIELEIYVGALAIMHNASDLGFSKDRGAVSF